ncbi:hypothetical protein BS47DRAFT_1347356, partial [Hydnum rufescens UP504]
QSPIPTSRIVPGSFHSKVVLTASIGGILVLVTTTVFLAFKIKRCLREREAHRRRHRRDNRLKAGTGSYWKRMVSR